MSGGPDEAGLSIVTPIGGKAARKKHGGAMLPAGIAIGCLVLTVTAAGLFLGMSTAVHTPQMQEAAVEGTPSLGAAQNCLRERDYACAEADLRAYLKKYPNDSHATALMAITLTQDGQHKEAVWYYKRAIAMGATTYDVYAGYAISLDAIGQTDEAIRMNYAALDIVPSLVDVRGALANQLVRKGRPEEALNLLETFDHRLEDQGQPPYFAAQIAQIKAKGAAGVASPQGAGTATASAQPQAPATQVQAPAAPGTIEIALEPGHGTLLVPVRVNNAIDLKFVVDSGAGDVTIPADVFRTLLRQGSIRRSDLLGTGVFVLADGSRVPAQVFVLRSLRVGTREIHDVTASVTNSNGSLLLGQSFLRRFKSWSIDNRRKVLVLQD
jgi:predicted aspartyl protease